ncbi:hypothetical protein SAMN04487917_104209 [Arthrobacter sp. yr096]|nr:hypothetical protein SAMN04487917_104209 [Arthrobacter sp. yr096]
MFHVKRDKSDCSSNALGAGNCRFATVDNPVDIPVENIGDNFVENKLIHVDARTLICRQLARPEAGTRGLNLDWLE